ncbi:hypothetical protein [Micromonospora sp. NPDC049240]|uniref:hypothetical protein n=1 Tax=Micromonospora sp. NPDC049240 TaxID=3155151 RepID=UPI0033DA817B
MPQIVEAEHYTIHIDRDEEDFHLDITPNTTGRHMTEALATIKEAGLELMDPEECEPTMLDNGNLRYWMAYAW